MWTTCVDSWRLIPKTHRGVDRDLFERWLHDLWSKYMKAALLQMQKDVKGYSKRKPLQCKKELSWKALNNLDDISIFTDYLKSDMSMELQRELKRCMLGEFLISNDEKEFMNSWIDTYVVREDEEKVYNYILNRLGLNSKWDSQHDSEYFNMIQNTWASQVRSFRKYIKNDREERKVDMDVDANNQ